MRTGKLKPLVSTFDTTKPGNRLREIGSMQELSECGLYRLDLKLRDSRVDF